MEKFPYVHSIHGTGIFTYICVDMVKCRSIYRSSHGSNLIYPGFFCQILVGLEASKIVSSTIFAYGITALILINVPWGLLEFSTARKTGDDTVDGRNPAPPGMVKTL